jgi:hypothetical protein
MISTKYILNPEAKKKCNALSIEKRREVIKGIEKVEDGYHTQLDNLRILKGYYVDAIIDEKFK